jgi:integrase/recombinase XerD
MWLDRMVASQRLIVCAYDQHLLTTCGLTVATRALLTWHVAQFIAARYGRRKPDIKSLRPQDIVKYVVGLSPRWKPSTRKSAVVALRSLCRWLQLRGLCTAGLVASVPTVSSRRHSGIPAHISAVQLAALLGSFDRNTPKGLRGYAATLCMARLGLRVGEVAQLTLADFDWREGTFRIGVPKGQRTNVLPLPVEVGEAIVAYIRNGRPPSCVRHVFVGHNSPHAAISKHTLRADVRRAFDAAGLDVPSRGTHVLRHTAATNLIRTGATIKEIADILGHRSIDTTGIYAKVDIPTLQEVAASWPKEATK